MDLRLGDDLCLLRDQTRRLLSERCPAPSVRAAWEAPPVEPTPAWRALAEVGVVGMCARETWGGLGLGELAAALVFEEAGRAALPEPLMETTGVAIPLLDEVAGATACDRWLGAAAAGRLRIAVAFDGPAAHRAELYLFGRDDAVWAATPAEVVAHAAVDRGRPLFMRAPGAGQQLAAGPAVAHALATARDRGALGASALLVGLAQAMIDRTVEYAGVREQFGRPIGSYQAVKHHLASALIGLEIARPLVHRAAWAMAEQEPDRAVHVSMAKAYASDSALAAARAALQCHGAIGYSFEYDLHLWMKRAWALAAAWGDAAWHRARIGRVILGDAA
jgi:alkylation response protein AidB-like acyl-CoA dehydrogenase